jgi:hypothetical protein
LDGKCPAEVYEDRESACRVVLGVFETQEDCARFHGCPERRCALEGYWPESSEPDFRRVNRLLRSFVSVAFAGPGESVAGDF